MWLDVPETSFLEHWAATAHLRYAAELRFFAAAGGPVAESVRLGGAYCVGYAEQFREGDQHTGAYGCEVVLSDPDGWQWQRGQPGTFVAPPAREHGLPVALVEQALNSGLMPDSPATAWAQARAHALSPARIAELYAGYAAGKKAPKQPRSQAAWWGMEGKRGGARRTVEGCLGEYQADQLFAAQGHEKLSNGGKLVGLLDPPRGKGLDGVWRNATPPPDYLITETKFTTVPGAEPTLSKGQMSDDWVKKNLAKLVGEEEALRIERAIDKEQVGKRLLHVDTDGKMHECELDEMGKISTP